MLTQCMNPQCARDLHYLREGRVVRCVRREHESVRLEHFWLCGDCNLMYDFSFSVDGSVCLVRKHSPVTPGPDQPLVLTLVA